jgi:hypothetical protein
MKINAVAVLAMSGRAEVSHKEETTNLNSRDHTPSTAADFRQHSLGFEPRWDP